MAENRHPQQQSMDRHHPDGSQQQEFPGPAGDSISIPAPTQPLPTSKVLLPSVILHRSTGIDPTPSDGGLILTALDTRRHAGHVRNYSGSGDTQGLGISHHSRENSLSRVPVWSKAGSPASPSPNHGVLYTPPSGSGLTPPPVPPKNDAFGGLRSWDATPVSGTTLYREFHDSTPILVDVEPGPQNSTRLGHRVSRSLTAPCLKHMESSPDPENEDALDEDALLKKYGVLSSSYAGIPRIAN